MACNLIQTLIYNDQCEPLGCEWRPIRTSAMKVLSDKCGDPRLAITMVELVQEMAKKGWDYALDGAAELIIYAKINITHTAAHDALEIMTDTMKIAANGDRATQCTAELITKSVAQAIDRRQPADCSRSAAKMAEDGHALKKEQLPPATNLPKGNSEDEEERYDHGLRM